LNPPTPPPRDATGGEYISLRSLLRYFPHFVVASLHVNTLYGQDATFWDVKADGTYSNECELKNFYSRSHLKRERNQMQPSEHLTATSLGAESWCVAMHYDSELFG
jgi:hypothetical protein